MAKRTLKENVEALEAYNERLMLVADDIRDLVNKPIADNERLEIHFRTETGVYAGGQATVTWDDVAHNLVADDKGVCSIEIPGGKRYSVRIAEVEGLYPMHRRYYYEFTAESSHRLVLAEYHTYAVGVFIVAKDGQEYGLDEWLLTGRPNGDASMIKFATKELFEHNGVFAMKIDDIAERTYGTGTLQWSNIQEQFNSIPLNGNSATAEYYYDGLGATQLIVAEGDEINVETPAADKCIKLSVTLSDGIKHQGFLGSVGQMYVAKNNSAIINDILDTVRPGHTYSATNLFASNLYKWTSTQNSKTIAWFFNSAPGNNPKTNGNSVVPFYAF